MNQPLNHNLLLPRTMHNATMNETITNNDHHNSDAVTLHQRLDRALFEGKYIIFWGIYFCFVGIKILSSPSGLVDEIFADLDPKDAVGMRLAASQFATILGCAWFTNGALVLMQRLTA